ncbi:MULTISPECIES: alpha/beta hydrolase family protein [Paenibacillus]|uniref:alpha/beta hydrolase family protein n=1 Tax=Paenibacillus TaxID=44249 RepID=UPI0022B8A9C4|nr:alpha/beta hydrolase [Paenibacillus caseinilyticus]MCZ8523929.1 alpha/beta hydrolase [Paenibacillus caseinilyticus]
MSEATLELPFILEAGELEPQKPLRIRGEVRVKPLGQEKQPVLLICHGFKGFKDWGFFPYAAERFAAEGYYTVTFNFSCNGVGERDFDELDKFAVNTYSREQEDLGLVLQALREGSLPEAAQADLSQVYLLGHSKGGGTSLIFAADHPEEIAGVITWNGIARTDLFGDDFKKEIGEHGVAYVANVRTKQEMPIRAVFYEDLRANEERFDVAVRLAGLTRPVLQVQGDQDSARLREGFQRLREAAPQHQALTVEGGNHTFGAVHPFAGTTPYLETALRVSLQFLEGLRRGRRQEQAAE